MSRKKIDEVVKDEVSEVREKLKKDDSENFRTKPPEPVESEELDEKQMTDLLVNLARTPYWRAIKYYNTNRAIVVDSSLYSIDPFKEPTTMARNQGIRIGLFDLEGFVDEEVERRKKTEEHGNVPEFGGRGY